MGALPCKLSLLAAWLALCMPCAAPGTETPASCDDLADCESRLLAAAGTYDDQSLGGVERDHFSIAETFVALDGGVPRLVQLLSHPDKRVAGLAAIGLRDADHIDERYLPALIDGLDRDLGWLAPALSAVPGERAAEEAVARYMVSDSAPQNQEGYAIERMGARAIPALLRAARCPGACSSDRSRRLRGIFAEVGAPLAAAVPELLAVAEDSSTPGDVAALQLSLIGEIGSAPPDTERRLLALRDAKPELREVVDDALIGIAAPASGRILAERLVEGPDEYTIREAADVGEAARDAAPALVEITGHADPGARILALSALGEVGGPAAISALVLALDDQRDIRAPWVAARALGRLRAEASREALVETANGHPFPVIRRAAADALLQLDGAPVDANEDRPFERLGFFDFEYPGLALGACERPASRRAKLPKGSKLTAESPRRRLESLAYETVVLSYGAGDEAEQRAEDPDAVIEVHPGNMVETRTAVRQVPHVALRVESGWLVGSNRGEWGGEVAFVPDDGRPQIVLDKNVVDIHRLGDKIVAVTGISHLFLNEGEIHRLERSTDGHWQAEPWLALPGAPTDAWITRDGALWVDVAEGSLLVTAGGLMTPPPCRD